jgi:hypothetical protein
MESSPAINAGVNSNIYSDYMGVPRPQDGKFDIGVYEYKITTSILHDGNENNLITVSPNPFSKSTTINYELQTTDRVRIDIYSSIGEKIHTLLDEFQEAGSHNATFSVGAQLVVPIQTGLYYFRIQIGKRIESGKLILVK